MPKEVNNVVKKYFILKVDHFKSLLNGKNS